MSPTAASDSVRRLKALRRRVLLRRWLGRALYLSPLPLVWMADCANRGSRLAHFHWTDLGAYLLASAEALLLWSSLLVLVSRRHGWTRHLALLPAVALAALLLGGQRYFYDQYATYMNIDAARMGASVSGSVWNQLRADSSNFGHYMIAPALVTLALVLVSRRWMRPRRTVCRLATALSPLTLILLLIVPCSYRRVQAATPDVLFMHAIGRVIAARTGLSSDQWVHPKSRTPDYLPALSPSPKRPRNVLFIITESQRADVICSAYTKGCKTTPFSNEAAPNRIPLRQLRSVDSTTAISLAVLWSGMSPMEPLAAMQSSPLLWSYAHAAGYQTAYITSQNLEFANARAFVQDLPLDRRCDALDLDPKADIDLGANDELATRRALSDLATLPEPYFAVVHYSNTHFPYRVDPARAPFEPWENTKDPAKVPQFINYYRNAVYLHDMAVGELIRGIRSMPSGEHTVIVFTADHGEAFREHYQLGHTGSIYDEETHVPGWVDAPPGTLSDEERAHLEKASDAFVWHLDMAPTLLDLLGLWDAPEVARYRAKMLGSSLLRGTTTTPMPMTNCAAVWGCPFRNWGMMRGQLKLEAREWDSNWHCFDVLADPLEKHDLGTQACGDLSNRALSLYGRLPKD